MISLARLTSDTPGSCTRIWSASLWRATMGSATPSSFTRRSMVCRAWFTVLSRLSTVMFGFIWKV